MTGPEQLTAWIERSKLTQAAAAGQFGIAPAILSQWLSGKRTPNLAKAFELEEKTGVPARSWALSKLSKSSTGRQARQPNASKSAPGAKSSIA